MLDHVGILWIIGKHEKLQNDMDKKNSEWMKCGPWYNTSICKKLRGKVLERFIKNTRTDRYNIMCYIDAYEKEQQSSWDFGISGGGCPLSSNSATEALYFLVTTTCLSIVG